MRTAIVLTSLCLASPALADEPPPPASDRPPSASTPSDGPATTSAPNDERTAADVAQDPLPGHESGRVDGTRDQDSVLRDIGQGVLLVPRVALEASTAPVRATLWAFDRYHLVDRWKRLFFDDTYTYGLYPTAVLDSSYGLSVGARFVHRNLFGEREHLALRGATGGEYRALVSGELRSGTRLGERTLLWTRGELERRPEDAFYGIGNSDDVEVHHRQELVRGAASIDVRAVSDLHVRAAGAVSDIAYSRASEGPPIDEVYTPQMLTGWMDGVRNLYGELELRWDSRRLPGELDMHGVFDRGTLLAAYGGRVHQYEAGADYFQYGGELQQYLRLGAGPRVLSARLRLDAVTGSLEDVAFTQLPQLGGKYLLRGYPRERFRDRVATLASLEYTWDLGRFPMASIFVDAGRVYSALEDIQPTDIRVGYGMSLQLHVNRHFIAAVSVASSIDGGVFVDLAFDPVFDIEQRVEQR
jgi:hypothetical protein